MSGLPVLAPKVGDGWISVKERLPVVGQWVLARHNRGTWIDEGNHEGPHTWRVLKFKGPTDWFEFGPDHYGSEITHWMPLPESPKEAEK